MNVIIIIWQGSHEVDMRFYEVVSMKTVISLHNVHIKKGHEGNETASECEK